MDMDTTIKGFKLDKENLKNILQEIIKIDVSDNIKFKIISIENIREDDDYGGLRVHLQASFDEMPIDLKIDVTTGDKITYKEINYKYNLLLEKEVLKFGLIMLKQLLQKSMNQLLKEVY